MNKNDWETIEAALCSYSWAKYGDEVNDELEELLKKVREKNK